MNLKLEDTVVFRLELFQDTRNLKRFKGYLWELKALESFAKFEQTNKKIKKIRVTERVLADVSPELGSIFDEFKASNKKEALNILLKLFQKRVKYWKNSN